MPDPLATLHRNRLQQSAQAANNDDDDDDEESEPDSE
jgi:hypothetical protein